MAQQGSARRRKLANGKIDFVTDYVTEKRHQFGRNSAEAALLESETLDTRIRPDISLKGYLAHFRQYMPNVFTDVARKNHLDTLRRCSRFVPDVTLAETDVTHIDAIMRNILGAGKKKGTGEHYLTSVGVALGQAIIEDRIADNAVDRFFAKTENRRRQPRPELDLPDPAVYPSIEAFLPAWSLPGFRSITAAGLHGTEAVALCRGHIRFKRGAIRIEQHYRDGRVVTPETVSLIRTVRGIDKASLMMMLDAPRIAEGDDFVLQKEGWPGKPWTRSTMCGNFYLAIRNAQLRAGIASLDSGDPFSPGDFRNRWIADRLVASPEEWLHTMVQAGYANVWHFTTTYAEYLIDPESHAQMELSLAAMSSLARLPDYRAQQS